MINNMEKLGTCRRSFSLTRRPPHLYSTRFRSDRGEVEVFEPYDENLPLEAGFYTFILDESGRFRIRRGNTSSHASFSRCGPVGGAGHFRINRAGNVAEVFCLSLDYQILVPGKDDPTVSYVIEAFRNHHALEVSPLAVFRFKSDPYGSFFVSVDGELIDNPGDRLEQLESEGQSSEPGSDFTPEEAREYARYRPDAPPRLYPMHRDQLIIALESDDDGGGFEVGPPKARYAPDQGRFSGGKKAFVIDPEGWLIVGFGHHILSGGGLVGAAGQVVVEPSGFVGEINLNFSGHYRPPLDGTYARYTYRSLANHPLITLSPDCRVTGRVFDDLKVATRLLRFSPEELLADDPELDQMIEHASP